MPKTGAPSKRRITVQYLEVGADTLAGIAGGRVEVSGGRELATALIIMSTAHAVVIVEGIAMLAESFLRRRYEAGLQEGREEGRAEGREMLQRWQEWNRRRTEAEARGERFEEPPPGE